ncbi:MFS transporter, NHS family, nucleoside permease [Prevotella sp. khp1]|uniref:MFS transporter n=1 Tax=Prevotellaceae TaxID=171552 RepID=UPI00088FB3A4|nr:MULTISPECIES: MFS transporter [Prevotellaceae]QVJ81074.1 MFS transporter [Xylanibacter ruminicola]SDQ08118.1 MFS transporter, NHS family, nucleoside permease [Prevotella sp. khp1]
MNLKFRLSLMNFLEFAVWGAYLTCMGNYLGVAGLGDKISWFYAIQGIVSIFMPTLMGIVADKYIQPQRLLGLCHMAAGGFMLGCWWLGLQAGFGNELADKSLFITLYTLSVAFFMPTIALSNTAAFTILKNNGLDTVKDFPPIRVLGTVGFIVTMWFVNCAVWQDGSFSMTLADSAYKFQYTYMQFFVSGILSIVLCFYCFTLPECKVVVREKVSLIESLGLNAFKLFKSRNMALFFIFSALLGMCLQVTNGYAGPFITSFKGSADAAIASSFAANNATLLTSISQISEALCILMIPFFLKRYGIKTVMLMSMFAWVFRFGFFGVGNPAMPGVIMFILSCIVYGVAFDFFNVSGGIFVDQECEPSIKASAQGLFMMMTNGVGATVGTLAAGEIVNHYCYWENGFLQGEWTTCWFIFAAFALAVGISFALVFHPEKK